MINKRKEKMGSVETGNQNKIWNRCPKCNGFTREIIIEGKLMDICRCGYQKVKNMTLSDFIENMNLQKSRIEVLK